MTPRLLSFEPRIEPSDWDAAFAQNNWQDIYNSLSTDGPTIPALRLLAVNASGNHLAIRAELNKLQDGPLARGARLMAFVTLGRYREILDWKDSVQPKNLSPDEVFDAANASFAVAMAASASKDNSLALIHLHAAHMLASALMMPFRLQHIALEMARIRNTMGKADPAAIRSAMASNPMTDRRATFASGVLAESYLILGDYETAESVAPMHSGLQAFAAAMQGRATLTSASDEYGQLAAYLLDPQNPAPLPEFEPEASYTRLIRAMRLLHTPSGKGQAVSLLTAVEALGADQRLLRGLLLIAAQMDGAYVHISADQIMREIREGIEGLSNPRQLATFLRKHEPRLFMLLAVMPGAPSMLADSMMVVPMFAGNTVVWEGRVFGLPSETGSNMFARQLLRRAESTVHRQEKKRFTQAWEAIGLDGREPVSVGWLMMACAWASKGDPAQYHIAWATATKNLFGLVSGEEARTAAAEYLLHS